MEDRNMYKTFDFNSYTIKPFFSSYYLLSS